jgi:hypothetical protein
VTGCGSKQFLNSLVIFPIWHAVHWPSATTACPIVFGPGAIRGGLHLDMSQPLGRAWQMSHITLGLGGAGSDLGLPPFGQIARGWLPPERDGSSEHITLAVAGLGVDELAVTAEDGQFVIGGKQVKELPRDYIYRGSRRARLNEDRADGAHQRNRAAF